MQIADNVNRVSMKIECNSKNETHFEVGLGGSGRNDESSKEYYFNNKKIQTHLRTK